MYVVNTNSKQKQFKNGLSSIQNCFPLFVHSFFPVPNKDFCNNSSILDCFFWEFMQTSQMADQVDVVDMDKAVFVEKK